MAAVEELDDFGLPIRRRARSPPPAEVVDAKHHDRTAEPQRDEGHTLKEKGPARVATARDAENGAKTGGARCDDGTLKAPSPPGRKDGSSVINSDDDDFQDAPSTPVKTPVPVPEEPVPTTDAPTTEKPKTTTAVAPSPLQVKDTGEETPPTDTQNATRLASLGESHEPQETGATEAPKKEDEAVSPDEEQQLSTAAARQRSDTATSTQALSGPSLREAEANRKRVEEWNKDPTREGHEAAQPAPHMSEFSHQQLTAPEEERDESDGEWQTMPAYAPYDIYDDDDRLVAKEHNVEEDNYGYAGLGGAGKGYTRVLEDDAASETSMDGNTKYLFKDPQGTSLANELDADQRDAVSQLQETKNLLTEGQRIAYVGLTRLELFEMIKEAESIEHTKRTKKEISTAAEAMKMWAQKIMVRLYAHMEISPAEQIMIEQLAAHGVIPQDLTPVLMQNARVKNPMADDIEAMPDAEAPPDVDAMPNNGGNSPRTSGARSSGEESPAQAPPPYESHVGEEMPDVKMPSDLPSTDKIDIDLRWTVLCDLFLVLIADSIYDSRSRVLLERVGKNLEVPWIDICRFEKRVTDALEMQQQAEQENWNEDDHLESRRKLALKRRYVMMGLATVGGGLVIGLSAGLLAPLIGAGLAAGFTTIGVGGTSTFLAGAGGAAMITSGAAASGGLIGGRAAGRRTGAVKTFEYRPLHNNKRVNLVVTVSGWMTSKVDDVRLPFSTVDPIMGDIYSILWEPEMLTSMGDTINILATEALTQGLQQVLGSTILIGLMAALQLPVVLSKLSYLIDNPWAVSLDRAWSAGLILADSLIDRNLGTRPVTLVGYSLGSRVIFACLMELARKGAYGLVQNVYMFGSPLVFKKEEYLRIRTVVAGRFVNGYNRNDWILGYLFRLTNGGIRRVAGLAPIEEVPGIENVDCTEFVVGHMDYRHAMPRLLRHCDWLVESDEFTEIEDPDPEQHRERQRELINEIEEARKNLEKEGKEGKEKKGAFAFFSRKKKQRADWELYEENKPSPATGSSRTEDQLGNNHGVLFDVDAMRAELANDHDELPEPKELQSTLPPMKLSVEAEKAQRAFRESESGNGNGAATALRTVPIVPNTASREGTPTTGGSGSGRFSGYAPYLHAEEEEVQMTFEDDYRPPAPPPKDVTPYAAASPTATATAARPEMQTSQTLPNIALHDPWGDDEDDFGKEEEISMTFA